MRAAAKKGARNELRKRAKGLQRKQVDELLDVIWPEHELPVPPAPARPNLVDWATGMTSPLDQARTTVGLLEGTGRWIRGIVKSFRGDLEGDESPSLYEDTNFIVETGADSVEVELDLDAPPRLRAMSNPLMFTSRTMTTVIVELIKG